MPVIVESCAGDALLRELLRLSEYVAFGAIMIVRTRTDAEVTMRVMSFVVIPG